MSRCQNYIEPGGCVCLYLGWYKGASNKKKIMLKSRWIMVYGLLCKNIMYFFSYIELCFVSDVWTRIYMVTSLDLVKTILRIVICWFDVHSEALGFAEFSEIVKVEIFWIANSVKCKGGIWLFIALLFNIHPGYCADHGKKLDRISNWKKNHEKNGKVHPISKKIIIRSLVWFLVLITIP